MNKIIKSILIILAGVDVTVTIFLPIIIAALWIVISGLDSWTAYFFYGLGLLATMFRAIKIGGWLDT